MDTKPDPLTAPAERGARLLALAFLRDARAAHGRMHEGGEALHDFRVALRRLRATLSEYRAALRPDVRRRDRRRAAALVRPTGAVRDAQVQAAWVREHLARLTDEERAGGETLLVGMEREAERPGSAAHAFGGFARRLEGRLATYRVPTELGPGAGAALATLLAARIEAAAERLGSALAGACAEPSGQALHRTRLAAKRLRYLVEPFAAELEGGGELLEALKHVQEVLGGLNDLRLLGDRIAGAIARADDEGDPDGAIPGLRALGRLAAEDRERGMQDLRRICGPEAVGSLMALARSASSSAEDKAKGNSEIERKYLLRGMPRLPDGAGCVEIWQGWIPGDRLHERIRRVRPGDGSETWLRTVKLGTGVARVEVEEEAPADVARRLWPLTRGRRIRKRRWTVPAEDGLAWEVDRFTGRDLVLAEIELPRADYPVSIPEWLRPYLVREVTGDSRYVNLNLAR